MTTQTMLEKMARAHDAEDAAQRGEPDPWSIEGDDFEEFRAGRIEAMRAALQALREPTEEMVEAMWERTHWASGDPIPQDDEIEGEGWVPAFFRAAIDAALQELG